MGTKKSIVNTCHDHTADKWFLARFRVGGALLPWHAAHFLTNLLTSPIMPGKYQFTLIAESVLVAHKWACLCVSNTSSFVLLRGHITLSAIVVSVVFNSPSESSHSCFFVSKKHVLLLPSLARQALFRFPWLVSPLRALRLLSVLVAVMPVLTEGSHVPGSFPGETFSLPLLWCFRSLSCWPCHLCPTFLRGGSLSSSFSSRTFNLLLRGSRSLFCWPCHMCPTFQSHHLLEQYAHSLQ